MQTIMIFYNFPSSSKQYLSTYHLMPVLLPIQKNPLNRPIDISQCPYHPFSFILCMSNSPSTFLFLCPRNLNSLFLARISILLVPIFLKISLLLTCSMVFSSSISRTTPLLLSSSMAAHTAIDEG